MSRMTSFDHAKSMQIYGFPQRPMRCRFCSIRFKYESVMIEHEDRLHKDEKINEMKKRAAEKENIQQIVFFLKSEETNFDKFRKSEGHERWLSQNDRQNDRQNVRKSPERIQKRISPKLQKKIKLPKIKV